MSLNCEALEVRITPTTSVWSGVGADALWTNSANWAGNVAPVPGNDLVFPAGVTQLSPVNNFPAGTSFRSIEIDAAGYFLSNQNPASNIVVSSGITATYATGNSSDGMNTVLGATIPVRVDGGTFTFDSLGSVSDGGNHFGITQTGTGVLDIDSTTTYTGPTTVNSGTLLITGDNSSSSGITVNAGAHLAGYGTAPVITSIGGTVGADFDGIPETLTSKGSLSLDANSTFTATIKGNTSGFGGSHYSQVNIAGPLALNGATFAPVLSGGYMPQLVDSIDLITGSTSATGTFKNQPEGSFVSINGNSFKITYVGGVGGHDVVLNGLQVATTTVTSGVPNPSIFSTPVTLTATVTAATGTPTGSVTFMNGLSVIGTSPLNQAGSATISTSTLPIGTDTITAVYSGGGINGPSTSAAYSQVVNQVPTTITVASGSPTQFGQVLNLTATLSPSASPGGAQPTGIVTFFDGLTVLGTSPVVSGPGGGNPPVLVSFSTSSLSTGDHTIRAVYGGDAEFAGSSNQTTLTVFKANTALSIYTPQTTSTFGQGILIQGNLFTSTQTAPTGTVTYSDGSTVLSVVPVTGRPANGGVATGFTNVTTPTNFAPGSHVITLTYSGDGNYVGGSAVTTLVVVPVTTSTALAASTQTPFYGQPVTYTAVVRAVSPGINPTSGMVIFFDGVNTIGTSSLINGQASLTVRATGVGQPHIIHANFSPGDVNSSASASNTLGESVVKAESNLLFYYQVSPKGVGFPTTVISALFGSGHPTGTLTFYANGRSIRTQTLTADGMGGVFFTTSVAQGKTYRVSYSGDTNYNPSNSASVKITPAILMGGPAPVQVLGTSGFARILRRR